jgi:MinD superfamily P-loop ATPase
MAVNGSNTLTKRPIRIAIASGKGGTGKTLLATNLFYSLHAKKLPVTLIDCDAEEPNDMLFYSGKLIKTNVVTQRVPVIDESRCTYCGKCHVYCQYNAIFILPPVKVIKVIDDLCHGCGACSVACKYDAISEKEVALGMVRHFAISANSTIVESRVHPGVYSPVSVIKAATNNDFNGQVVIMDSPPGTSCPFIHAVSTADYVILVTEPTPFGLSDLRQSVQTLRLMNKPCGVILNRADMGNREIDDYMEEESLSLLMEIPFDREVAITYAKGDMLAKTNTSFREELYRVYEKIDQQYGNSHH